MIATPHLTPVQDLSPVLEELGLSVLLDTLPARTREAAERNLPYEEFLRRVLADAARARRVTPAPFKVARAAAPRLQVGADGRWFEVAGGPFVDLSRRGPIRRILWALVRAHAEGRAIDVNETVETGWPGEPVAPDQGATRVYTAIRTLRRLGLDGVLLTRDAGYLLDPRAQLTCVDG